MPPIQPRTLKGFRDYLPPAMLQRERIIDVARRVFRSYGFAPIDTRSPTEHTSVDYEYTRRRFVVGDAAGASFEIVHQRDHIDAGSRMLTADTVRVRCLGLPEGMSLVVESVRPPNHGEQDTTVALEIVGPAERVERVRAELDEMLTCRG